jgi:hypothetical protein
MPKAFEINAFIQEKIGYVIWGAIILVGSTLFTLFSNMQTNTLEMQALKAEVKQLAQHNGNISNQFSAVTTKHAEEINALKYEMGLMKQTMRILANKTPEMRGMINHEKPESESQPPIMRNFFPSHEVRKVGSSCEGEECILKPVDPPKPDPVDTPKPTTKP